MSSKVTTLGLGLIGPGTVGSVLLEQIKTHAHKLIENYAIDIRVYAIANSRKMVLGQKALELGSWKQQLEESHTPVSLDRFGSHLKSLDTDHVAVVDCTAGDEAPLLYTTWAAEKIHIVTPNKKFVSGPFPRYRELKFIQKQSNAQFFYEGTVGAGLPVISSLKTLLDTGDQIRTIEGVFSGTLSYIFNNLGATDSFADVVRIAQNAGYTEPDPRDDLSGMDVARKILILARECGCDMELSDVATQSLVPEALRDPSIPVQDFLNRLAEHSADLDGEIKDAAKHGSVLRFVGKYDAVANKCEAVLRRFSSDHPFANLSGTENIVSFRTGRYDDPPLKVNGPGAGPDVTAAGVFGDIIQLALRIKK